MKLKKRVFPDTRTRITLFVTAGCLIAVTAISLSCAAAKEKPSDEAIADADPLRSRILAAERDFEDNKDDLNAWIELGRSLYLGGVQRPEEPWLDRSIVVWEDLMAEYSDEPLVLGYAGSVRMVQSREARLPWTKGRLAREGEAMLNRAVEKAPQQMEVRWLRAVTAYQLPPAMGAREQAEADFAWLAARLERSPAAEVDLEAAMIASVWYHRGLIHHEAGETEAAREAWRRAVEADAQSGAGRSARELLEARRTSAVERE